ncbi:hypothetical protein PE074_08895 [Wohlfahrtiimonas chitiniclastica]|uniref:Uncharacterized protein n=1 Tax=Wohlfahrtiimonas chitiniclastica SH04 TaxID=1261130 RepID=L8Y0G7_9GAMM|nr:hypothetical protein [Wohlfahrtiimonas chitiniclastica]ELV08559.1 Hypothetical protein F387_01157 [Wohlfahrtiimonas chitiniclastica SH04]WHR55201.1 hypothetical protein PE074_08895 [Wohlfahrtiimonas chitiniclastica]
MFGFIGAGIAAISGAVSAGIGAVCSTVGGAIISTGKIMMDAIRIGIPIVKNICDVSLTLGKAFGLFSPEHNENDMQELGVRVEQAAEENITSDQFDSNQAYIEHIREKVNLSKENIEKLDKLSDEDKLKYICIGGAMTLAAVKEKYQINIPDTFWITGSELGISADQIQRMLDVFEKANIDPDIEGFLKGKLTSESQSNMYDLISNQLENVLSDKILDKILG